jgi:hypothetical protein
MPLRFGLAKKLLCVCLAFGLPIVVMWVLLTQAKLAEIRFAEKELAGDAFQRPLERVLQHVGRHFRLLSSNGEQGRGGGAAVAAAEHPVSAALDELELQHQKHGALLQFTPLAWSSGIAGASLLRSYAASGTTCARGRSRATARAVTLRSRRTFAR